MVAEQAPEVARRWCLGTRLVVAATAVWAVFLVLHVLLAGRWWPWLALEATPPIALVVVPVLLLGVGWFARPVRRRLAAVLAVLLLVGAYLAGYLPPWSESTNARGTEVKVFAWSTDYWQMSDDKDAFYAFLRAQDADVYLLQEYLYWAGDDHPIRIDDTARLRAEFPGYELSVDGELLTLSRLPVLATHHRPDPGTDTGWYWQGTKSQRTDLRVADRTISFYNVHLPVPFRIGDHPLSARFYRFLRDQGTWRLRELDELRADLAANPNPVVVAGDFNSPWMELTGLGGGTTAHHPDGGPSSTPSWPVSDYPFPRLWRLDWLYTSGDLAVPGYRFGGGEAFSDHAAQEIRVVVPPAP
ncbi:endonuclease/exonuclease/phosphatase family protein [Saccharothrix variisporea]|uniref:Endonuclease/exonuclease/phosphatase family metal-dependent hydrolase n=1 Tax=Saccharothrix variisporea TaxID=543527 RepID=A0A495X388_9PSEU|nr:endonuclease/exonuclease/phosphatase family protein [Saccharothrix variisporea]RKT67695.1 endonuclease/exonuclease/phosphatase family metal-dependent hydrolase [Saccharothrix variisporea]